MSKLRVLCLHGFYNNVSVMKHQFAYYEYVFRDYIQFDYINAPYVEEKVYDKKIEEKFEGPFYTWVKFHPKTKEPSGFIESWEYIKQCFEENGPYDGIIGFSQGGYVLRTMLKAEEWGMPHVQINPKFCMIVGSAVPHKHIFKNLNDADYPSPLLYIYGKNDPIVQINDPAVCLKREKSMVIWHDKGHAMPKFTGKNMESFIDFYNYFYEEKFGEAMTFNQSFDEDFRKEFILNSSRESQMKQAIHKL